MYPPFRFLNTECITNLDNALDQRLRGRRFESSAGRGRSRSNRGPVALCTLGLITEPSILSGSVNEYRLRLGRSKACPTLLCARNVLERLCGGIVYLEAL